MDMELILKIVGALVVAIPSIWKAYRVWKESRDWRTIARIGLDFIEHHLENQNQDKSHAQKKDLQVMQETFGVAEKVDAELDELRKLRKKTATNPANSLEFGTDVHPDTGKWMLNARYRRTF